MKLPSIRPNHTLEVEGFELNLPELNTIMLLGLGVNATQFVANAFEQEVYRQTPSAQVLSISLVKSIFSQTKATRSNERENIAVVDQVRVGFPIEAKIRVSEDLWSMRAMLTFDANRLATPEHPGQLAVHFNVIEANKKSNS